MGISEVRAYVVPLNLLGYAQIAFHYLDDGGLHVEALTSFCNRYWMSLVRLRPIYG